jgi:hypothetical protein
MNIPEESKKRDFIRDIVNADIKEGKITARSSPVSRLSPTATSISATPRPSASTSA